MTDESDVVAPLQTAEAATGGPALTRGSRDPDRVAAMLKLRSEVTTANPGLRLAYQIAPLMGEYTQDYWAWQLDKLLDERLGEGPSPDAAQPPTSEARPQ